MWCLSLVGVVVAMLYVFVVVLVFVGVSSFTVCGFYWCNVVLIGGVWFCLLDFDILLVYGLICWVVL